MLRIALVVIALVCLGSDASAACGRARRTPVRTFIANHRPHLLVHRERHVIVDRIAGHGVIVGPVKGGCVNGSCAVPAKK